MGQRWTHTAFYAFFGLATASILLYYLSDTIIHFTSDQQFPVNSFVRYPLTIVIFAAELFSFLFALYFVYLLLSGRKTPPPPEPLPEKDKAAVAILVPAYNEPASIVERTIAACRKVRWKAGVHVYLLDDSTDHVSMNEMEAIARSYHCTLVRRPDRKGFKAGNINHAIRTVVKEHYFVIFDSDQAPLPSFLEEMMDHFSDPSVGFVQAPQYFINRDTPLERSASLGTNIFFQAQCNAKSKDGATPFCGTNVVVKTELFREVNGFSHYTSTEDIDLGLRLNERGYFGAYVPKVLAHGYAPYDFPSYASQQYRWANGNLAILRERFFAILSGNFSLRHHIDTFFTLGWWFIGLTTLSFILVPLVSLFFHLGTHHTWLPTSAIAFLYIYVVAGIMLIYVSLDGRDSSQKVRITDALLQYSLITNSIFIYVKAALNAIVGRYSNFVRTDKRGQRSGLANIAPNLILASVCFGSAIFALLRYAQASDLQQMRTYLPVSLWLLFYSLVLYSSIIFVGTSGTRPTLEQTIAQKVRVPLAEADR